MNFSSWLLANWTLHALENHHAADSKVHRNDEGSIWSCGGIDKSCPSMPELRPWKVWDRCTKRNGSGQNPGILRPLRMDVVALALMCGGAGDRADNLVVCGVKLLEGATQCALEPIIDCEQGKARLQSMSLRITDYRQIARRHHHHRMR